MPAHTGLDIRIENDAGVPYGPGPLVTAQDLTVTARLDRAGRMAFTVPLSDPRAQIVQAKRTMRARGVVNGVVTDLGTGIIDRLTISAQDEAAALAVEGDDLLRELTYNLVDGLEIYEYATMTPDNVQQVKQVAGASTSTDLPPWPNSIELNQTDAANNTWLYIRHNRMYDRVLLTFAVVNVVALTMQVQYFNGRGWTDVVALLDATQNPVGTTWGQNGTMGYTMPTDWVEVTHDNETGFWLRMRPAAAGTLTTVTINSLTVRARNPTATGPALILAYAPAGWSLAGAPGHATTAASAYYVFEDNTTVLAALIQLAELTGEHFRLGTGRTVVWLQGDETASGLRAVQHLSSDTDENDDAVLITQLERTQDSYELVNRIYPTGSGFGGARLTLRDTTLAAPAGYTLSTANNYIEKAGATPRISRAVTFDEMRPIDAGASADPEAADQLFALALTWLQQHDTTPDEYRLTVTKLPGRLYPGDTLRVVYLRVVDGTTVLDIDEDLLMLEVEMHVDGDGTLWANLLLSTLDRYPETDLYRLARDTQRGARVRRTPHPVTTTGITTALVTLGVVTE